MSFSYLEDLEQSVAQGELYFACPGPGTNEWHFATSPADLEPKAQRAADVRGLPVCVFRLVSRTAVTPDGSFLTVLRKLEPGPRGKPNLLWAIVGSAQAAELLRDVSDGPTPYFGVVVEKVIDPRR